MALNIKNQDVEKLLNEVVDMTGETKTEAVRRALEERRQRLRMQLMMPHGDGRLRAFLEEEIWPRIPADQLGKRLTKAEEEAILGY
jgi:antitoxin VapB